MILGLDTASVAGNKNPRWDQARDGGFTFAIIRAVYGRSQDKVFARDWNAIRAAGLVRGGYLFLRFPHPKNGMKAPKPEAQAEAVAQVIGDLLPGDLPPSLDIEFPGGRALTKLSAKECLDRARRAWDVLHKRYGCPPLIYTSGRVWREELQNLDAPPLFAESPLWLARYPFRAGLPVMNPVRVGATKAPPVPRPWGDADNWWIHQYQGDADGAFTPGFCNGNVDLNRFNPMALGAKGDRVRWVQKRVGAKVDGDFGPITEAALRKFQGGKGLIPDGLVGPRTFAYLACAPS